MQGRVGKLKWQHVDHIAERVMLEASTFTQYTSQFLFKRLFEIPEDRAALDREWNKFKKSSSTGWKESQIQVRSRPSSEEVLENIHVETLMTIVTWWMPNLLSTPKSRRNELCSGETLSRTRKDTERYSLSWMPQRFRWQRKDSWTLTSGAVSEDTEVKMVEAPNLLRLAKQECPQKFGCGFLNDNDQKVGITLMTTCFFLRDFLWTSLGTQNFEVVELGQGWETVPTWMSLCAQEARILFYRFMWMIPQWSESSRTWTHVEKSTETSGSSVNTLVRSLSKSSKSLWPKVAQIDLLHRSNHKTKDNFAIWEATLKIAYMLLFQDASFASDSRDSKSASGGLLCVFGSYTHISISLMCKKHSAVSHSSAQSETLSSDAGSRMDGLPALEFWECVLETFSSKPAEGNLEHHTRERVIPSHSHSDDCVYESIDQIAPSIPNISHSTQLYIFEDKPSVIQMINQWRSPSLRHVTRTYRVDVD